MQYLISAFEPSSELGGGVVTSRAIKVFGSQMIVKARLDSENRFIRTLNGLLRWLRTPWLHPIFCVSSFIKQPGPVGLLNFSQTFSMIYKYPDATLIAHDILVQKKLFFPRWLRWSEKHLFSRANRIMVLSNKDAKLCRRLYSIPSSKIDNIFNSIFYDLNSFESNKHILGKIRVAFIGSFNRVENKEAFDWFYTQVFPFVNSNIEVFVIGKQPQNIDRFYPSINFCGFVDDLRTFLSSSFDISIAPLQNGAGVKIKVIDALVSNLPVLGTHKAYEGIGRVSKGWCTNKSGDWIQLLNSSHISFSYRLS